MATYDFDVLIIGAGPAGSAAAIMFAQHGYSVGLIEAHPDRWNMFSTPSIAAAAEPILRRIGVFDELLARGMVLSPLTLRTPFGTIENKTGYDRLNISRRAFDLTLRRQAGSVAILIGGRGHTYFSSVNPFTDVSMAKVILANTTRQSSFTARLYVSANGHHNSTTALIRPILSRGGTIFISDLQPRTLTTVVVLERNHDIRYLMPCEEGSYIASIHAHDIPSTDVIKKIKTAIPEMPSVLSTALSTSFRGPAAFYGPRISGRNLAIIGDAAISLSPVVGDGIFRALRSAEILVDEVVRIGLGDKDGIFTALQGYERRYDRLLTPYEVQISRLAEGEPLKDSEIAAIKQAVEHELTPFDLFKMIGVTTRLMS